MAKHTRVRSSIDNLPADTKKLLDDMLADTRYTYAEIVAVINERGEEISRSSLQRYAMRSGEASRRLREAQEQAKALVSIVKENPDIDYTDAGLQIAMNGLINKISTAEEEFADISAEKAVKLMVAVSRTDAYKQKVRVDTTQKVKLALKEFTNQINKELERYPELKEKILLIAQDASDKAVDE
ncbi:MAG: hypothetical protein BWY15_00439 [Firmicutes bacterium ADurb.Bin193]|nr:MAG: hypothetical protein BWY15_00439 [Firmicutes bacterium ADurb.Bin193]